MVKPNYIASRHQEPPTPATMLPYKTATRSECFGPDSARGFLLNSVTAVMTWSIRALVSDDVLTDHPP
jgi:hypothetical protein